MGVKMSTVPGLKIKGGYKDVEQGTKHTCGRIRAGPSLLALGPSIFPWGVLLHCPHLLNSNLIKIFSNDSVWP